MYVYIGILMMWMVCGRSRSVDTQIRRNMDQIGQSSQPSLSLSLSLSFFLSFSVCVSVSFYGFIYIYYMSCSLHLYLFNYYIFFSWDRCICNVLYICIYLVSPWISASSTPSMCLVSLSTRQTSRSKPLQAAAVVSTSRTVSST